VTENVAQLPARVLVVDDAVVARRIISDTLEAEADLTVAGYARDGDSALRRAAELRPDVVVLDLDLPGRSGVEILSELRRRHPQLPVVVFSRLVLDDPSIIPAMLSRGAAACLAKPGTRDGIGLSVDDVRSRLTAAVRTAAASPRAIAPRTIAPRITLRRTTVPATTEAIVIAASTGGPMALERLVSDLPSDLPVPVFVVQHMPPPFPRMLANRLRRSGCLTVTEAGDREPAHPGRVYLAPGGHHLTVGGIRSHPVTFLDTGPPENSCRPAADKLFRTAAALWGPGLLAIVLTGMGRDGLLGCELVRRHGGTVLVQDRETSVVWGMPRHVAEAGLAHAEVPIDDLATHVLDRLRPAGVGSRDE
jgi:two-component system, chemotaxis family, protein-glutamate methylesterase/glutaminase